MKIISLYFSKFRPGREYEFRPHNMLHISAYMLSYILSLSNNMYIVQHSMIRYRRTRVRDMDPCPSVDSSSTLIGQEPV